MFPRVEAHTKLIHFLFNIRNPASIPVVLLHSLGLHSGSSTETRISARVELGSELQGAGVSVPRFLHRLAPELTVRKPLGFTSACGFVNVPSTGMSLTETTFMKPDPPIVKQAETACQSLQF